MSMPASEHIRAMSEKLAQLLHPEIEEDAKLVQKGMLLYRQGLVTLLRVGEDAMVATVQDVVRARVELDVNFFEMSQCSCPANGICRHQMAVFFLAYSKSGSVADWIEQWRKPVQEKKAEAALGMEKARDLIKANGILKPDYDRWIQSFGESFTTILQTKQHLNPYVVIELFRVYRRRLSASAPVKQEWKLLYDLIGTVFSFQKLAELSQEMGYTNDGVRRTFDLVFSQLIDEAESLVQKLGVQTMPFAFDAFIEKLKDDTTSLLTAVDELEYDRIYLYRLLWSHLFKKKSWREDELKKIELRLEKIMDWENPIPLQIAGVHVCMLLQMDDSALRLISSIQDEKVTPYLLYWIELFSQQKSWNRAAPLIDLLVQKVKVYLEVQRSYYACTGFTNMLLKAILPFCKTNERFDLYERALLQSLPYSYAEYEISLFEQGMYDKWSELQSFIGYQYDQLPKDRLKVIEKEQPEVLISLLHQSAQQQIDLKNRQSYKSAVRQLKKLRTIYKKQKRVSDWQFFFENLLERTRRLRAFHEECKRSKLIDA
ncbi:MAG: SWIM zinc finger family protein [Bacillota bacterium]|nr:SWIM zinc finger family protein [Bacillota bacterium]